jgi:hypothetical protein
MVLCPGNQGMDMRRVFATVIALSLSVATHSPAMAQLMAQEKGAVKPGFSAESLRGQTIVLFRPSVWVGEQSTAAIREPRADWTAASRLLLTAELRRRQASFANRVIDEPVLDGRDGAFMAQYRALFNSVASAVMTYQFFPGNRLPTRKNRAFDWTLGEESRRIGQLTGARYALFVSTNDQYGSTGRKVFQAMAAQLLGTGITSGVHVGYAGLVDLQTGALVWLNADNQMGGDVRTAEGVRKRVGQLLEDFPGLQRP